jgi:hypothetical protein
MMTNGEMIRQMSDVQLAVFLNYITSCCASREPSSCKDCPFYGTNCDFIDISAWLEKERFDDEV